ncbi:putative transmembrane protein [alpha proteobacterium BAL199]|jgi:hypothetical protein|nr:putative transmembrane protein [alpha proteobacterium BAL199]
MRRPIAYKAVFFVALLATALAVGGALAHAYELPNKIDLSRDEYFVVQKAYAGWNRLAYVLLIQFVSMVAIAYMSRRIPKVRWLVAAGIVFFVCAQAVFWTYTAPANAVTENWTVAPDNWEVLRQRWEYSHLAGAMFQLLAMSSLIVAALRGRRRHG